MRTIVILLVSGVLSVSRLAAAPSGHPVFESGDEAIHEIGSERVAMAAHRIDELVSARLKELNIERAGPCSDAVFLRRAYLCAIGTLPTPQEAEKFLGDPGRDRRDRLIEELLARDEFVDYWAMKWGDLLRVKAEFPINLWPNAVQAYHRWIYTSVKENQPYDQFARELLTSNGSNFRVGPVNFYRAMQDRSPRSIAATVALTFMGERAERWRDERRDWMAGFFAQVGYKSTMEWKEEIIYFDPSCDTNHLAQAATFPDGTLARIQPGQDPRIVFADWLIDPANPWFTRNIANRSWSWLMGRGIIHEPDDIRPGNGPSNPALLKFLEAELAASRYDLRHLFRAILNSQVFQRSCIPATDTPEAAANFAHYPLRRIEAEVLIDALNQITGTHETYSSPIPEPFTFIPEDQRAIALADGSITSSFLEQFGRSSRDTGLESEHGRNTTASQRLHLLNSSHIQKKLVKSPLVNDPPVPRNDPDAVVERIYLGTLSRYPTAEELAAIRKYATTGAAKGKAAAYDLVWALINTPEFLHVH